MRIGIVTPGFSSSEADWCVPALLDLVRELARRHDVWVLALRYPHRRDRYAVAGARVEALGGADRRGPRRLPLLYQAVRAIGREAKARPFDVLQAFWAHEPGVVVTTAGRLLKTPTVVSMHGGELASLPDIGYGGQLSAVNRLLIRHALQRADAVTAVSHFLAGLAKEYLGALRTRVLPLGVDTNRFHPAPVDGGAPKLAGQPSFLNVASLSAVKDQDTLLRAFQCARRPLPAARLHLVGDGDRRAALERLAVELGIDEAVRFHGAVPHDRLAPYYRGADLCVVSSRFEGMPVVALEAAFCGLRTVGSAVGLLPEIADHSTTVSPHDPDALGALLVTEARRPKGCPPPGDISRERLDAEYGLQACVARLTGLYQSLCR